MTEGQPPPPVRRLPFRQERSLSDDALVVRAGLMRADGLTRAAARTVPRFGRPLISVYGIDEVPGGGDQLTALVRAAPLLAERRQLCRSSPARLRTAGLQLLPTFDWPHYSIELPDLDEATVELMRSAFDEPEMNHLFSPTT